MANSAPSGAKRASSSAPAQHERGRAERREPEIRSRSRTPDSMPELVDPEDSYLHRASGEWRSISEAFDQYFEGRDAPYPARVWMIDEVPTWLNTRVMDIWWKRVLCESRSQVTHGLELATAIEKGCAEALQDEIEKCEPSANYVAELAKDLKNARNQVEKYANQLNGPQFRVLRNEHSRVSGASSSTAVPFPAHRGYELHRCID